MPTCTLTQTAGMCRYADKCVCARLCECIFLASCSYCSAVYQSFGRSDDKSWGLATCFLFTLLYTITTQLTHCVFAYSVCTVLWAYVSWPVSSCPPVCALASLPASDLLHEGPQPCSILPDANSERKYCFSDNWTMVSSMAAGLFLLEQVCVWNDNRGGWNNTLFFNGSAEKQTNVILVSECVIVWVILGYIKASLPQKCLQ